MFLILFPTIRWFHFSMHIDFNSTRRRTHKYIAKNILKKDDKSKDIGIFQDLFLFKNLRTKDTDPVSIIVNDNQIRAHASCTYLQTRADRGQIKSILLHGPCNLRKFAIMQLLCTSLNTSTSSSVVTGNQQKGLFVSFLRCPIYISKGYCFAN